MLDSPATSGNVKSMFLGCRSISAQCLFARQLWLTSASMPPSLAFGRPPMLRPMSRAFSSAAIKWQERRS